jgi:hypothetical protein
MMLVSWIVLVLVITLALSLCAVALDALAGAAYQNERARYWVRRVLLLEATEDFANQIVSFTEMVAAAPSMFRAFLLDNAWLFVLAALAICDVAWFTHHMLFHAETFELRLRDSSAVAVGVVVFALAVYRIVGGSETRRR